QTKIWLLLTPSLASLLVGISKAFDLGLSTKCVQIPNDMDICNNIEYSEMRLPNLMGQTTLEEVVPKSEKWKALLQSGCHDSARFFICSLYAPICMDTFLLPCRSMCEAVRDSCSPVLACQGQSWPQDVDCDRFPDGDEMCLLKGNKEYIYMYSGLPEPICHNCPAIEESISTKTALDTFCDSDFAVRVKLARRRFPVEFHKVEIEGHIDFIVRGDLVPYDTRNMINQWMLINGDCGVKILRNPRSPFFIITGVIENGRIVITRIFHWQKKDFQLTMAVKKWHQHKC
uniref:Secreted frizzled-related protein 2 n=1 Tax=Leptobrachium leishanense TaxID=445787 RepID=A0A8C5MG69_9ANUR